MSRRALVPFRLLTAIEDPANGQEGEIYVNTITKNLRVHNGITWVELTPPSTDPTPFYMHTHTYDGEVHTIDIQNKIMFENLDNPAGPEETLPIIVGYEGGTPSSVLIDPSLREMTLFDGGTPGEPNIGEEDTIIGGGSSVDFDGDIMDGGGSI